MEPNDACNETVRKRGTPTSQEGVHVEGKGATATSSGSMSEGCA